MAMKPGICKRNTIGGIWMNDLISRQAAIDALWKALYEYEDKTEKQFQESEDLDIQDWILHRIFVQNMSDIDRQTIIDLPPVQPETATVTIGRTRGETTMWYECDACGEPVDVNDNYCRNCGRKLIFD